ncbi:MAG: lipopolysaccharide biosynthesis protein [Bacteroidetes bacterium]|nr:MAG: lipopolysaccharide biosynthesis protein [Bacteroidota bacterium]
MGLVRRQSILNTFYSYAGVALGLVNKLVFFNVWLSKAEFGLIELLITFMVLGSELSQLGVSKVILRFFPYFHQRGAAREGQFVFFTLIYALTGYLLLALLLWLGKPWILAQYAPNAPLFAAHYSYVFPVILAYTAYRVLSSLAQAHLRSVMATLSWNLVVRVVQALLILGYHYGEWSFETFMYGIVLSFTLPTVLTGLDLLLMGKMRFRLGIGHLRRRTRRVLLTYGLYASLGEMTAMMVNKVDILMIGWLVGEEMVATYAIAFYITSLIQMPARALRSITIPLIAGHLKHKRFDEIRDLYQKSAITSLVIGMLVLIGIWVNLDPLYALTPKHGQGYWAVVFLGIGSIFNIMTGLHRAIIVNSRYYRFDLYMNLLLLGLAIGTNYWLIPPYGAAGAAIATAISLLVYNGAGCLYVWWRFDMQPFSGRTALTLLLGVLALSAGLSIPDRGHPLLDIAVRTAVVLALYLPLAYWARLSPDFNELARMLMHKLGLARGWRR